MEMHSPHLRLAHLGQLYVYYVVVSKCYASWCNLYKLF